MQAKICDVCGQICKPTYKGKEYAIKIIDWDDDSLYHDTVEYKLDVCDSCQNKLKLWIQSKGSVQL